MQPGAPVAAVRRPRGRPPKNTRWDTRTGAYIPVLTAARLPTPKQIWALVTSRVTGPRTPTTLAEALAGPQARQWHKAVQDELTSLRKNGTWKVIDRSELPRGAATIKTKWVFKIKRNTKGEIVRYKARLTACGYAQKFGRDFNETFSPVASAMSIRT